MQRTDVPMVRAHALTRRCAVECQRTCFGMFETGSRAAIPWEDVLSSKRRQPDVVQVAARPAERHLQRYRDARPVGDPRSG